MSLEEQATTRLNAALGKLDEAFQSIAQHSSENSRLRGEVDRLSGEQKALQGELEMVQEAQGRPGSDPAIDEKLDQAILTIERVLGADSAR